MRRDWDIDALITSWSLVKADWDLIANKYGATRLGFAVMIKYFEIESRFPRHRGEVPAAAVEFVASQVKVDSSQFGAYELSGRTAEYHRRQIRDHFGLRVFSSGDADKLAVWMAEAVCGAELQGDRQREALLAKCRTDRIEPPGKVVADRLIARAGRLADETFCVQVTARLSAEVAAALEAIVAEPGDDDTGGGEFFTELKADPVRLGLETLLAEITKLHRIRAIGVPENLLTDVADARIKRWRARAAASHPSVMRRDHTPAVRLTLLAVLVWCRHTEVTDSLVDLFIQLVHRINTRAERRVDKAMVEEYKAVDNKTKVLYKMARTALEHPDSSVRSAIWATIGEDTLRNLDAEAKATEAARNAKVRTTLTGSYSHHYRRMLPRLLEALEFRSNNTAHRPVMDAVELLERYADRDGRQQHYDRAETVPVTGVVPAKWRDAVADEAGRVVRVPYELCALEALAQALRRKEIWVAGAAKYRNPETYLPPDFDTHRDIHYQAVRQPEDAAAFIAATRSRLDSALARLAEGVRRGTTGGVSIGTRKGNVWISVPRRAAQPEPSHLGELKDELVRRWGVVSLLDVLKEADLLTGFTNQFSTVATREEVSGDELRRRLLLVLFGLGTNIGIKRMVHSGDHKLTEAQLRRIRGKYVNRDNLRAAIAAVVGDTLTHRDEKWWGNGTACASDSKKFGSWESNLMTEWHNRYGGPGVMVYWHVERKSVCVYSQLKTCSSSEVAAMMEGLIRHSADLDSSIKDNYTDTHGASVVGFAFTHLLGYRLLPRLKDIGLARLYRPDDQAAYPGLETVLSRPIRWDLIQQQYDQMVFRTL